MTFAAVRFHQRCVDVGFKKTGRLRPCTGFPWRTICWRYEFKRLRIARKTGICPVVDPGGDQVSTGLVAVEPAVVTACHFADHLGVARVGQRDDGVGGSVGQVDIVRTNKSR